MNVDPLIINAAAWDSRTAIHIGSEFYDTEKFKEGKCTLQALELALLGNIKERTLLHLQCHFGLDTLSLGRRGAICTGIDLSPRAIESARTLALELKIESNFHVGDCQGIDFLDDDQFDIAFSSYGIACWIGSLKNWAQGIHRVLKSGGRFVLVDYHPILNIIYPGLINGKKTYFGQSKPWLSNSQGTYADREAPINYQEYRWAHSISSICQALVDAGFNISHFEEHLRSPYNISGNMIQLHDGLWQESIPEESPPYLYSIVASK